MTSLTYSVVGKGVRDRETALAVFWKTMETQNGNRRRKPQEFIKIDKVVHRDGEGWNVHYSVPDEVLKEKDEQPKGNYPENGIIGSPRSIEVEPDTESKSEIKLGPLQLPVSAISTTGLNPRKRFDPDEMKSLVESIRASGILQPLLVRPAGEEYELVIGERRLRAAKELGLETVPAVIREMTDEQVLVAMLTENLQREDLTPIEQAEAIQRAIDLTKWTHEETAERLGKSRQWVGKRLQLLAIPNDLQQFLLEGKLSPHHVELLVPLSGCAVYTEIVRRMKEELKMKDAISVRTLQALIDGTITGDFRAERSLNLNEFPYEYKGRRHCFGVEECLECKKPGHVIFESADPSLTDFCVDRPCYSDKLNRAKQKFEEASKAKKPLQTTLIKIVDPSAEACDGCPAWDLKHHGCLEGHGNASNCPQHDGGRETVKKIGAEVSTEQTPTDIEETSADIVEKVPSLKTQKCHVLECVNETEPGSHWCKDHQTPESRRKEPEVEKDDLADPDERRVITRKQYALVKRSLFLSPSDEKEPRFEELERAGRPAKDIVHRYKNMPRSNTAKRDLMKWCYPPLEEVDI
jgi:ParB/RepB/Spo0J family partition protein